MTSSRHWLSSSLLSSSSCLHANSARITTSMTTTVVSRRSTSRAQHRACRGLLRAFHGVLSHASGGAVTGVVTRAQSLWSMAHEVEVDSAAEGRSPELGAVVDLVGERDGDAGVERERFGLDQI